LETLPVAPFIVALRLHLVRPVTLYRSLIGYVPQDDIVHCELTVAQALRYAARLRLPADTSGAEIGRRIAAVLQQVGLSGQGEQVIRSLSGGERKRVSIALELLADACQSSPDNVPGICGQCPPPLCGRMHHLFAANMHHLFAAGCTTRSSACFRHELRHRGIQN
jgi:hypothetical protein